MQLEDMDAAGVKAGKLSALIAAQVSAAQHNAAQ